MLRGLQFTGFQELQDTCKPVGVHVRRGRDGACAAQCRGAENLRVFTGQHLQLAVGNQGQRFVRVAAAVLDRLNIGVLRQLLQRLAIDPRAGTVGNVVDEHRQGTGVGDGFKPVQQTRL